MSDFHLGNLEDLKELATAFLVDRPKQKCFRWTWDFILQRKECMSNCTGPDTGMFYTHARVHTHAHTCMYAHMIHHTMKKKILIIATEIDEEESYIRLSGQRRPVRVGDVSVKLRIRKKPCKDLCKEHSKQSK